MLGISIFLFAISALFCLALLRGLIQIRMRMATELVNVAPDWEQNLNSDGREVAERHEERGKKDGVVVSSSYLVRWSFCCRNPEPRPSEVY